MHHSPHSQSLPTHHALCGGSFESLLLNLAIVLSAVSVPVACITLPILIFAQRTCGFLLSVTKLQLRFPA